MQFFRARQYYRLLNLKTLTEYYAACDGYTLNIPVQEAYNQRCTVVDKGGERARMSRALFVLLQRISLSQMTAALGYSIGEELRSIEAYMQFFVYNPFVTFLTENRDAIRTNEFAGKELSDKEFDGIVQMLISNKKAYLAYMRDLCGELQQRVISLEISNDTVLGLYSQIPQLASGLVARAKANDRRKILKDSGIMTALETGFTKYCSGLRFEEEDNITTVVVKYIGSVMGYFFPSWFSIEAPAYQEPKVTLQGEDSKRTYIADNVTVSRSRQVASTDLYDLFSRVLRLDCDLFQMKKNREDNPFPYYSLVDFVISLRAGAICGELNAELSRITNRSYRFGLLDSLRTDTALQRRDGSFIEKINNYRAELKRLYDSSASIGMRNFKTMYSEIISDFDLLAGEHKDSNTAYVKASDSLRSVDGVTSFMPDTSYSKFGDLLKAIGDLIQLDLELESKGSSLAVLWDNFLNSSDRYDVAPFSRSRSAECYLTTTAISKDVFSDGLNIKELAVPVLDRALPLLYDAWKCKSGGPKPDTRALEHARLSSGRAYSQEGSKLDIAACAYIAVNSVTPVFEQDGLLNKTITEYICTVMDCFHQGNFDPEKRLVIGYPSDESQSSDEARVYDIDLNTSLDRETFCWQFIQEAVMFACDNYSASQFYDCMPVLLKAVLMFTRGAVPPLYDTITKLRLPSEQQCAEVRGYFSYTNLADRIAERVSVGQTAFCIQTEELTFPQNAAQIALNHMYIIAYVISSVLEGCRKAIGDSALPHLPACKEFAIDVFLLVVDFYQHLSEAMMVNTGAIREALAHLAEISVEPSSETDKTSLKSAFYDTTYTTEASTINRLSSDFTIEQTQELLQLTTVYKYVDSKIISELQAISDICLSPINSVEAVSQIERRLQTIIPGFRFVLNLRYMYDADYNTLVALMICGSIKAFLKSSRIMQGFSLLRRISEYRNAFVTYISQSTGISDCKKITHTTPAMRGAALSYVRGFIYNALRDEDFASHALVMANLSIEAKLRFDMFKEKFAEDSVSGFLMHALGDFYTIATTEGEFFYLHKTGVFVGYNINAGKFDFLTFEEAYAASLVEDVC